MGFNSILTDHDAYLQVASSENADQYYLTGFSAADEYIYLRTGSEEFLIVPRLEYGRAVEESEVENVESTSDYLEGDSRDDEERQIRIIEALLKEKDVEDIAVPGNFDLHMADELRSRGIQIEPVRSPVTARRMSKKADELEKLEEAQSITEEAMKMFREVLENSEVRGDLLYHEGELLTSERARKMIKEFLIDRGCDVPEETIVACGEDAAQPHNTGSGPLKSGKPVIVDIFPLGPEGYFGDMTRTFVRGEPDEETRKMYRAVQDALDQALEMLSKGEGLEGEELHKAVAGSLEEAGYSTDSEESGFLHSTGHAVGLELHEPPRIAEGAGELEEGYVLTIEPGLYEPAEGGVRLEDMIVLDQDSYRNFNSMSYKMVL